MHWVSLFLSGSIIDDDTLLKILSLPILVVLDEAYIEFAGIESKMKWVKKYENLIVLRTFSKRAGIFLSSFHILSITWNLFIQNLSTQSKLLFNFTYARAYVIIIVCITDPYLNPHHQLIQLHDFILSIELLSLYVCEHTHGWLGFKP